MNNTGHFLLFLGITIFAWYFPWIFDWQDTPQYGIDYWSSNKPYSKLAWLGFPTICLGITFTSIFILNLRFDVILTILIFWTSLFAMFTGIFPLAKSRSFVYVYNRRKALWVGFLQFLIACTMVCLILILESQ